jgi:hypothetical protein
MAKGSRNAPPMPWSHRVSWPDLWYGPRALGSRFVPSQAIGKFVHPLRGESRASHVRGRVLDLSLSSWGIFCSSRASQSPQIHSLNTHPTRRISHLRRVCSIIWDLAAAEMRRVLSGIRGRLPLLTHLEISCFGSDSSGISDILAVAPQLRQVLLVDTGRPSLSVPWYQLTHFRAPRPAQEYLEILRKVHNLVDCGIDLVDDELPPVTSAAILRHLRGLFTWGTRFLRFLTAPNLEYPRVNGELTFRLAKRACARANGLFRAWAWILV